jgi:hypothetical protein
MFKMAEASSRKELEDIVMSLQQELSKAMTRGKLSYNFKIIDWSSLTRGGVFEFNTDARV